MPLAVGVCVVGSVVLIGAMAIWAGQAISWAYDFRAYYDAAVRLMQTGSPYQAETLSGPFSPGPFGLYLYAPPLALAIAPLTQLDVSAGAIVWLLLRMVAFGALCWLLPVSRPIRLAMIGIAAISAPVLNDLRLGNISILVTLLSVVAWRTLDRSPSGVAMALAALARPTMAVLFVWWLARRIWRPVLAAVATVVLVIVATLPFMGIERWLDFATVLRNVSNVTGVWRNADLGSALLQLGGPAWAAPLALFAGYVVAVGAILLSLRRDRELSFIVTATATLLLSPLLWDHYLTQLILPAAFLASRGHIWGLALPLLAWLPLPLLPLVAVAGTLLPFMAGHGRSASQPAASVRAAAPAAGGATG
jgi:alpha-1,2-mannosyltransferase